MIHLDNVRRELGGEILFDGVTARVGEGDRIGIVGPNGAGKTTLLRLLSGQDQPDGGRIDRRRDLRVGVLPQEVASLGDRSILEVALEGGAELAAAAREVAALEERLIGGEELDADDLARISHLHDHLSAMGGYDLESRARRVLAGLGFKDEECERSVATYSGGWMMRVALARLLLSEPDLLLLDEPTNHLDLPSLEWLEGYLQGFRGAIILVSHDQVFLDRLATSIFEVASRKLTRYAGNYTQYAAEREVRREQLERAAAQQNKHIAQQERFIERFRAKNTKASQVQSRIRALDKLERVEVPDEERRVRGFKFPPPPRTGHSVVKLEELTLGYGDNVVLKNVELEIVRGDRVALVGRNGEGKTTLARAIAGELAPLAGTRTLGHKVTVATFGQHQVAELALEKSVMECASELDPTGNSGMVRGVLGAFLFDSLDLVKPVGVLSGGEKSRLALARMMLAPAPLMVMDEPTNHLDIASREALESALLSFQGTLVLVSHDRRFLRKLATVVLEVADGGIARYEGGFDDYLFQREVRRAAKQKSATPTVAQSGAPAPVGKERRKQAADLREVLRDHTNTVRNAEKKVAALEKELAALDHRMADPAFYENGGDITVIKDRATAARRLESAMDVWMKAEEKLQAAKGGGGG